VYARPLAALSALALITLSGAAHAATKTCDVKAYGATGDGKTKDTAAIQKAIDDCAAAGGGEVVLAGSPMFVTGPLTLKSHITLSIAAGTTLAGSEDHDDYPLVEELREHARAALLTSDHASDIVIHGGGVIDGRGQSWWPDRSVANKRPRLIVFRHSKDIVMEDVGTPILISEFYPKIPDVIDSQPVGRLTPHFSDITIENLTATGAKQAAVIVGLPESPITGLKLNNIHIKADKAAVVKYAKMSTQDVKVTGFP
jgi:hypothetical protein